MMVVYLLIGSGSVFWELTLEQVGIVKRRKALAGSVLTLNPVNRRIGEEEDRW